jgi:hypothetical protein
MNQLKNFRISLIALALAAAYFCIFTLITQICPGKQDDLVFALSFYLYSHH